MRGVVPSLLGFVGGLVAGLVALPYGGMELAQALHPYIRVVLYPNRDPMAGLLFDPLVVLLSFAIAGAAMGFAFQSFLGRRRQKGGLTSGAGQ